MDNYKCPYVGCRSSFKYRSQYIYMKEKKVLKHSSSLLVRDGKNEFE